MQIIVTGEGEGDGGEQYLYHGRLSNTLRLVVYAMTRAIGTARKSVGGVAGITSTMLRFRAALNAFVPAYKHGCRLGMRTRDVAPIARGRRSRLFESFVLPEAGCRAEMPLEEQRR